METTGKPRVHQLDFSFGACFFDGVGRFMARRCLVI